MMILVGLKEHNTINIAQTSFLKSPVNWLKMKYNKWDYTPKRFKCLIWGPQNVLNPWSKIQMFNEAET